MSVFDATMPIITKDILEFISRSPEQTGRLGARLGTLLQGGEVIALEGKLGAGKTLFAQGVGMGWGSGTRLISPTFVLMRQHKRFQDDLLLCHIDLYRLNTAVEIEMLGLDDVLGAPDTICLVEWADRDPDILPADHLWVTMKLLDDYRRSLTFQARGPVHQGILNTLRKEILGK